ncbi:hypothetical protein NDU88_002952 [Pleurodeles waltl]|uniref:Uncharacterized protein n=1 Tax=Pleurodeles waltl TaxID=8319 RepID=A0AAV7UYU0_PLEWA|nr:hypothetical protein NDU88_002952 [Pleurodeles waltl]
MSARFYEQIGLRQVPCPFYLTTAAIPSLPGLRPSGRSQAVDDSQNADLPPIPLGKWLDFRIQTYPLPTLM